MIVKLDRAGTVSLEAVVDIELAQKKDRISMSSA
jgi:hypothetical protein